MRIAIIGAGVAGLAAGRRLAEAGHAVTLFDKGRGAGGRLSTKRWDELRADLGAQYATARTPGFRALMADLAAAGAVAEWRPRLVDGGVPTEPWHVGVGGMSALVRAMVAGLPENAQVRLGVQVAGLTGGQPWGLADLAGGSLGEHDVVLVATPAEQAAVLLGDTVLGRQAAAARTAPCWAAALRFGDAMDAGFDAGRMAHPVAGWVARAGSRPGAADQGLWVVHAGAEWSRAHLELVPDEAALRLAAAFADVTGVTRPPVAMLAHRWRYALVEQVAAEPFGWDAAAGLGSCGDWHGGPRVEAAWLSGDALAAAVVHSLGK